MKIKHWLCGTWLLFVWGCNIFNPSDDTSVQKDNASMLIYEGQKKFRESEYESAANFFASALQADSSKSEAWFGLAKANLYRHSKNPLQIVSDIQQKEDDLPLMGISPELAAEYYDAVHSAIMPLRELVRRDTITQKNPSLKLSDRKVVYSNFSLSYGLLEFAYTVLRFRHSVGADITVRLDDDNSLQFDLGSLYESALEDSALLQSFNQSLDQLQSDLAFAMDDVLPMVSETLENSGLFDSDDSIGISQILDEQTRSSAESAKWTVSFYKIGDGIDNDGDGCIDEEILDGKDNDGDGLIDEDLRLVPLGYDADSAIVYVGIGKDSIDHDQNGVKEDSLEHIFKPDGTFLFAENFERIHSGDSSYQAKQLQILKDSDETNVRVSLSERQRLIGRCWNNYTQNQFKVWFQNRQGDAE